MPFFAFMGIDRAGTEALRQQNREAHRQHLRETHADCRLVSGGPLLTDAEGPMCGSLLIFEAGSLAAVERVLAADPYAVAGLFERTELRALAWTVGAPSPHSQT